VAAAVAATPTCAVACDCIRLIPGSKRFDADLDRIAAYYQVAADGVLEADGPYAWRLRPIREYRGRKQSSYPISLASDCSVDPQEMNRLVGKKIFVLLAEGSGESKGRYELSRCVNLQSREVESAIRSRIDRRCEKP
jgi:hypothetical protein